MSPSRDQPPRWKAIGPGVLLAATGVGAGDLIAAAVAGRRFGLAVLWVVVLGAACKWVLNEGIARWQWSTGDSLITGWRRRLPSWVSWYFGGYLVLWSFLVAGALGSACGVATKALWPDGPGNVGVWSAVHAIVGFVLVRWGRFALFERVMRVLIAAMFLVVTFCAFQLRPDVVDVAAGLFVPRIPQGGLWFLLGVMGGVGGSATLLCYGYWIREKGWQGETARRNARIDLPVAYALTAVFGVAMIVLAAGAKPADASGTALVVALSDRLGVVLGEWGRTVFLVGFWCAVFSSLLGVWQGVPYLWEDWKSSHVSGSRPMMSEIGTSRAYRGFLAYLAFPPLLLQLVERPLMVVIVYAIAGAFFMPFLAATLLIMNNRSDWVGQNTNPKSINAGLGLSLLLFVGLLLVEIVNRFS